jgi:hypothetical protein
MKNLNRHKKLKRNYSEWHSIIYHPVPPLFITLGKCKIFLSVWKSVRFPLGGLFGWVHFPGGGGYGTQGLAHVRDLNTGLAT